MATQTFGKATPSPLDSHASPTAAKSSGTATASFVVGIISVIGALIAIVGLILGVTAIVMGHKARSGPGDAPWQATAGFVLGILGTVLSVANGVAGAIIATS
jgi:hypothetical protein